MTPEINGTWTSPGNATDLDGYSDAEVQFVGTITTAYYPWRALDRKTFEPWFVYDKSGNPLSSVGAANQVTAQDGSTKTLTVSIDGGCPVKFTDSTGSGLGAGAVLTLLAHG